MHSATRFTVAAVMLASGASALTAAQCTHTVPIVAELAQIGPTGQCIFSSAQTTITSTVDCGGCSAVNVVNEGGSGPECLGVTTAPGTMTVHTAVCSGASSPTGTDTTTTSSSSLSINPGGPMITAPPPSPTTTATPSCSTFFTSTPGCNPAADNVLECQTTVCQTTTPPSTIVTSTKKGDKGCSTVGYEVFGAEKHAIVSCPSGLTASSTTEQVGIPTCRFCENTPQ